MFSVGFNVGLVYGRGCGERTVKSIKHSMTNKYQNRRVCVSV